MEFKSLKDKYIKMMADKISVSIEDLTDNEKQLIEFSYELFSEKLEDIKIANDELRRISIELANLKSYRNDFDRDRWNKTDLEDDEEDSDLY